MTAIASPIARPDAENHRRGDSAFCSGDGDAEAGLRRRWPPMASDASSYSRGTASSAVTDTLMMDGRIITASTIIDASQARSVRHVEYFSYSRHQHQHSHEAVHH